MGESLAEDKKLSLIRLVEVVSKIGEPEIKEGINLLLNTDMWNDVKHLLDENDMEDRMQHNRPPEPR